MSLKEKYLLVRGFMKFHFWTVLQIHPKVMLQIHPSTEAHRVAQGSEELLGHPRLGVVVLIMYMMTAAAVPVSAVARWVIIVQKVIVDPGYLGSAH